MKILKKKRLGIFEVYLIFFACIYIGFIGYKSLLNIVQLNYFIFWADFIKWPPSWSSSSLDAKNKQYIPNDAIDNEIERAESSSINMRIS